MIGIMNTVEKRVKRTYTFRIDDSVLALIRKRAEASGVTISDYLREAIESFSGATAEELTDRVERRQEQAQRLADLSRQVAILDDAEIIMQNILEGHERRLNTA